MLWRKTKFPLPTCRATFKHCYLPTHFSLPSIKFRAESTVEEDIGTPKPHNPWKRWGRSCWRAWLFSQFSFQVREVGPGQSMAELSAMSAAILPLAQKTMFLKVSLLVSIWYWLWVEKYRLDFLLLGFDLTGLANFGVDFIWDCFFWPWIDWTVLIQVLSRN